MTPRALRLTMASCTTRSSHKSRLTGGGAQAPDPQEPEQPFYLMEGICLLLNNIIIVYKLDL